MDIKKLSLRARSRGKRKKGDTAQLAAQLAPLEEQDKDAARKQSAEAHHLNSGVHQETGAIVVDRNDVTLPTEISDARLEKTVLGMEPVVLVILTLMLAFIAFIAWQISQMPVES